MPANLRWGEGYNYVGLTDSDIIAEEWQVSGSEVYVEADVSEAISKPGVYTLTLVSDADVPRQLGSYSIFIEG